MSTAAKTRYTPEQYLVIERAAQFRSEYYGGKMFAMVGASRKHNLISVNFASELHHQFKDRGCEVYQSDMRFKVSATGLYTYPDVVATCDEPRFEDTQVDTLLNPKVIVEVFSPSTELSDRGKKFEHYRRIPSLREYVLIAQDRALVERYAINSENEWVLTDFRTLDDVLILDSVSCQIKLSDIYARVDFSENDQPEQRNS